MFSQLPLQTNSVNLGEIIISAFVDAIIPKLNHIKNVGTVSKNNLFLMLTDPEIFEILLGNNFIGFRGTENYVYKFEFEGRNYAILLNFGNYANEERPLVNKVSAFREAINIGLTSVPHVVYLANDGRVAITEWRNEQPVYRILNPDTEYEVRDIEKLVTDVIQLLKHGVTVDTNPRNFLYSPETGFIILDLHIDADKSKYQEQAGQYQFLRALFGGINHHLYPHIFGPRIKDKLIEPETISRTIKILRLSKIFLNAMIKEGFVDREELKKEITRNMLTKSNQAIGATFETPYLQDNDTSYPIISQSQLFQSPEINEIFTEWLSEFTLLQLF